MTKDQKVEQITNIVKDARRFYEKSEFSQMVDAVWNGYDQAKNVAKDGASNASTKSDLVKIEDA